MAANEEKKVDSPVQLLRTVQTAGYTRDLRLRRHRRALSAKLSYKKPLKHELRAKISMLWDQQKLFQEERLFQEALDDKLIKAIINDEVQNVKMLLEKSANPNAEDDVEGFSALMWATHRVHVNCVRILVESKCNVSATTEWGWSALMDAAQRGDETILTILLEAKAKVNERETQHGRTSLLEAALVGNPTSLMQLLDAGAAPAIDVDGNSALHHAAMTGCLLKTQILVEYLGPWVVNRRKIVTGILLHYHRRLPLSVAELISAMAIPPCELEVRNREGKIALDLAVENSNHDIVQYLRKLVNKVQSVIV